MPTENRSSNTEVVSVKRDLLARIEAALDRHMAGHAPMRIPVDQTDSDLVREELRQVLGQPAQQHQSETVACAHEWTDDGEFLLVCTKCGEQEDHDPKWRDIATAPRDGTLLRLLVEFTEHATEDSEAMPSPTIGANSFDHTGEDVWKFAGWSWEQDCFTQGEGEPVGWLPMLDTPSTPAVSNLPELTDDLREILGRPNFTCHFIAKALRIMGHNIAPKSEDEQAVVIHWLIGHYLKHGADWRQRAEAELKAASEKLQA